MTDQAEVPAGSPVEAAPPAAAAAAGAEAAPAEQAPAPAPAPEPHTATAEPAAPVAAAETAAAAAGATEAAPAGAPTNDVAAAPAPSVAPAPAEPAAAPPVVGSKRSLEQAAAGAAAVDAEGGRLTQFPPQPQPQQQQPLAAVPDVAAAKRQALAVAQAAHSHAQMMSPGSIPRETIYRLVLNVTDTALIIGKGGNTVRQIEAESGGRVKRMQEPPGGREQAIIIWNTTREMPAASGTVNAAQLALFDCVRRVLMQDSAPMGQAQQIKMLISRTQEGAALGAVGAIQSETGVSVILRDQHELPACALDNDMLVELSGERYSLMQAVELLSWRLRASPPLERPGGPSPALRALKPNIAPAPGYGTPGYGGFVPGGYAYGR